VCKNSKIYATKYFFIVNKNKKSAKRGADGNSICKNIAKFAKQKALRAVQGSKALRAFKSASRVQRFKVIWTIHM
jgi:hypothetical protein